MKMEMMLYQKWCEDPYFDQETKAELKSIAGDEAEIRERFYRRLEFGTGGLRGIIGAGTNRMNIYTVRQATQGLANYILIQQGQDRGVAIACDSRRMSPEFADEAARCLNANGIKTYLFDSLRPTPELSFAVRESGCIAGIVITASHNPGEYNGYKVYWEDGAQITAPHDRSIMNEVAKVTDFSAVKTMNRETAKAKGLYHMLSTEMDDAYLTEMKKQIIHPEVIREMAKDIRIVYTPLHGAGNLMVRRVLAELGFEQVYVVAEQAEPDGAFPTVASPNPEEKSAWELALKFAREVDADIVLATDPDADRLGMYAKDRKPDSYIGFNGNMSGVLIAEYLLRERRNTGRMPEHPALVKTIVTTEMLKPLVAEYGVEVFDVLTGFKYIGEKIRQFQEEKSYEFLFGMEESYGCLAGTYARDKDACVAVMMLCEAAAFYKKQNQTLWDAMCALYERYGYYLEGLSALTRKGMDGADQISRMMQTFRTCPPDTLGGYQVLAMRDYQAGVRKDLLTGEVSSAGLPVSDVLYYELQDDAWCCVRPSGTEPKIKFYCGVKGNSREDAAKRLEGLQAALVKSPQ